MNWEAISAIGELLSAVGVIVTLIYLSTQIRQNSRALMAQGHDEKTRALREIVIFSSSPEQIEIANKLQEALDTDSPLLMVKASRDEWAKAIAKLNPIELGSFRAGQRLLFDHYQNQFVQFDLGLIDVTRFDNNKVAVRVRASCWLALGFASSDYQETPFTKFVHEMGGDA